MEIGSPKWAGEEYQEEQKKKMSSVPRGTALTINRGTKSMKISEYPLVKKIQQKGLVISTARGTATRIL